MPGHATTSCWLFQGRGSPGKCKMQMTKEISGETGWMANRMQMVYVKKSKKRCWPKHRAISYYKLIISLMSSWAFPPKSNFLVTMLDVFSSPFWLAESTISGRSLHRCHRGPQEGTQLKTQLDMNIEYSESTTASKYETRKNPKIWARRHSKAKTENSNNDK